MPSGERFHIAIMAIHADASLPPFRGGERLLCPGPAPKHRATSGGRLRARGRLRMGSAEES